MSSMYAVLFSKPTFLKLQKVSQIGIFMDSWSKAFYRHDAIHVTQPTVSKALTGYFYHHIDIGLTILSVTFLYSIKTT